MTDSQKQKVIQAAQKELGLSEEEAHDMVRVFDEYGGLAAYLNWPEQFSLFSGRKTI